MAGVAGAGRDARLLLAHVLELPVHEIVADGRAELAAADAQAFQKVVAARAARQPVSQILGKRAFWKHEFVVTPDVLDPRAETEHLVEQALAGPPPKRVLDLGTGSGCVILSVLYEFPEAQGLATDFSEKALEVAKTNANRLGLEGRIEFRRANWFDGVEGLFDLILSNPPYITADEMLALEPEVRSWEPELALTPGGDGLEAYRRIADALPKYLSPGGRAVFETGAKQTDAVQEIFAKSGYKNIKVYRDLGGQNRGILLQA